MGIRLRAANLPQEKRIFQKTAPDSHAGTSALLPHDTGIRRGLDIPVPENRNGAGGMNSIADPLQRLLSVHRRIILRYGPEMK